MLNFRAFFAASAALVCMLIPLSAAHAVITVDITSISPSDGMLDDDVVNTLTIDWEIEVDEGESGEYRVEVGGDGSPESGDLIDNDDGKGDFTGNRSGTSTLTATGDLDDGDGDYVIYVIGVDDEDEENYGSDSTTISLDNVPGQVGGLGIGVGDEKLFLSWSKSGDRDIDDYLVYYDTAPGTVADDYVGTDASEGDSPLTVGDTDEYTLTGLDNDQTYYVRIGIRDENGNEGPLSEEKSGAPATVFGLSDLVDEEGECFVATAAFGDYDAPEVRVLRRLRDEILLTTDAGRALVDLYYRTSPPLADFIARRDVLRTSARLALSPLVAGSALVLAAPEGWRWAVPAVFVLGALLLAGALLRRRAARVSVRKTRRAPWLGVLLIAGLLLIPAQAAIAEGDDADANADDESVDSPIHFTAGVNAWFNFLAVKEFEDVYDTDWLWHVGIQFSYKLIDDFEIAGHIAWGFVEGDGVTGQGGSTDEKYAFHLVPGSISLLYRLKFIEDQPIVPYVGAGFAAAYFDERRVEEKDISTSGGRYGYTLYAGAQILLDLIEKRAAKNMDLQFGVNNTYLYYEFRYNALDNFAFGDEVDGLDLTGQVHMVGLLFEF